jgi:proteasome beta subunit
VLNDRDYGSSDFVEVLRQKRPDLLAPFHGGGLPTRTHYTAPLPDTPSGVSASSAIDFLEGTTVLAAVYDEGVVIAGDRQATDGFQVGERRIQKVYEIDASSAVAIAGVAGLAIEMAKLFQVQVEFYEKIEGTMLSLDGKANYLSNWLRSNLNMALQGLVVVPIFAGYDSKQGQGRIFKYDAIGGRYDESAYYAIGSGGKDARSTLKKLYRPAMSRDEILKAVSEALWDAADEDLGTGGPDLIREIFPTIKVIDQTGVLDIPDSEVKALYTELLERLKE